VSGRLSVPAETGAVLADASTHAWERPKPDGAAVATPCLPHSIPRRRSDAIPYGPNSGCTGGPGHLVAARYTVDGSKESRGGSRAAIRRRSSIVPLFLAWMTAPGRVTFVRTSRLPFFSRRSIAHESSRRSTCLGRSFQPEPLSREVRTGRNSTKGVLTPDLLPASSHTGSPLGGRLIFIIPQENSTIEGARFKNSRAASCCQNLVLLWGSTR